MDRKPANIPVYNFKTHKRFNLFFLYKIPEFRDEQTIPLKPTDIVLFEGILALYDEVYQDKFIWIIMNLLSNVENKKPDDIQNFRSLR